ncbi:Asparagine synthetase domain-containing protein [Cercospora beticola]|uniref:Asparagine synthetase domain-containing protein n=1 Tax=Cercospora beticola TaxID=122368 RepID=A0A2G5ICW0_CERBT|nr:Asparagine synthetase domain-containing protein [Cercospora beticola]PIB02677.1 Asparagine synthetase domain-containing protein [Cercospora beticola]WPA96171.1 hypothetical protein RHO25_000777 [Cercospora beticola]
MCGIFCSVARHGHALPSPAMKTRLTARGPDASNTVLAEVEESSGETRTYLTLFSTVLSLRGNVTTDQPLRTAECQAVLCWNGEAWKIRGQPPLGNDTAAVHQLLSEGLAEVRDFGAGTAEAIRASLRAIARSLARVAGPYAFVFFNEKSSRLFFGRDFLGRRSLLWKIDQRGELLLSSVGDSSMHGAWAEVEADGVYCVDLALRSASQQDFAGCQTWGDLPIFKVPYNFADSLQDDNDSVIPRLSLQRELTARSCTLDETSPSVSMLDKLLRDSLRARILGIPDPPLRSQESNFEKAKLAILFSGGLDCTVLARICHDMLPEDAVIDLLNVAFQNPRSHKDAGEGAYELCPDRITGRASYAELGKVCSPRKWRFVAIDVPYSEYLEHRQQVMELMHPHNTEMDLSIAAALYFAARGRGRDCSHGAEQAYMSQARVLLSGLGADELFAGYTRHATAFRRQGYEGLLDELDLDVARLGKRNLGRDDRVISHWAREARFPFLDEAFVAWALQCSLLDKCDFGDSMSIEGGRLSSCASIEPGKKVLRCLAWKLGMAGVARERKRAIQFGARTAKMETGKTKGTTMIT